MITGDNPLTAVHVAREVEIVDRDVLILDLREGATSETDLVWRSVDEAIIIPVDPSAPFDKKIFADYDICITGVALKQYEHLPSWLDLVQHTWVYARVSPNQKEFILSTLKNLGYTTLMAGDGTNDVGALKQAHIGVALLDGSMDDLKKIAEFAKNERIKKVYESQVNISARFNQPPPPVPVAIRDIYPELVVAQQKALEGQVAARKRNPMERFDLASITDQLAQVDDDMEPPKIKLGDASCAAPFTSKLSNVSASAFIRPVRVPPHPPPSEPLLTSTTFPLFSHAHHPTGSMHARRYHPDVQDPRAQLSDHRVLALGPVPGRDQVRRLPGDHHRDAHERLLPLHLPSKGTSFLLSFHPSHLAHTDLSPTLHRFSSPSRSSPASDPSATSSTSTSSSLSSSNSRSTSPPSST